MITEFGAINFAVLITYFILTILIGGYFMKGQKNTRDYFLGGRNVPWYAVAASISATVFSSITYIGAAAEAFHNNISLWLTTVPVLFATPVVMYLILPFFYNLDIFTAYEYLEKRFDLKTRTFASVLFLLLRCFYTAFIIYAMSIALSVVLDFDLTLTILALGLISAVYTMLGGIKGVIWSDFLQFLVLFAGIAASMVLLSLRIDGGFAAIWRIAGEAGKLRLFDFSLDFTVPVTVFGALIGSFFYALSMYGADQVVLQRYLTTASLRESRKSLLLNIPFVLPVGFFNYLVGAGIYVFYVLAPDPALSGLPKDGIFPYFIATQMPQGLGGLVVAGIFAAAMSTISAALNSMSTASIVDFYQRFSRTERSPEHYLRAARWLTLGWGILVTVIAFNIGALGQVAAGVMKTNGFFGGVLLGIFLLGMLSTRGTGFGSFWGAIASLAVVSYFAFLTDISFTWYPLIGCITSFIFGWLLSITTQPKPRGELEKLVVKRMLRSLP